MCIDTILSIMWAVFIMLSSILMVIGKNINAH